MPNFATAHKGFCALKPYVVSVIPQIVTLYLVFYTQAYILKAKRFDPRQPIGGSESDKKRNL